MSLKTELRFLDLPYTRQRERLHEILLSEPERADAMIKAALLNGGLKGGSREIRIYRKWLEYLSDEVALQRHIRCVKKFHRIIPTVMIRVYPFQTCILSIEKRPSPPLLLNLHESCVLLTDQEIDSIGRAIYARNREKLQTIILDFRKSTRCQSVIDFFTEQVPEKTIPDHPKGRYFDLGSIFETVNLQFWEGKMPRPKLTWAARAAKRKMGSYDFNRDLVSVNPALDRPDVPLYVMEFLMYHELLHKHLGMKHINGKRMAHTAEFRTLERSHPEYERAEAFLKAFSGSSETG